jgi:hypothetical protein
LVQTAQGKQFPRPYLEKNQSQKRAGGVAQSVGSEFRLQYSQKKKKTKQKIEVKKVFICSEKFYNSFAGNDGLCP